MTPVDERSSTKEDDYEEVVITTTTTKSTYYKDKSIKIPCHAHLHPAGMMELCELSALHNNIVTVASYLVCLLQSTEQKNVITVTQASIAEAVHLSVKTVNLRLSALEANHFIRKVGKSSYFITGKLGWYGTYLSWAKDLRRMKVAGLLTESYYSLPELQVIRQTSTDTTTLLPVQPKAYEVTISEALPTLPTEESTTTN